MVPLLLNFPEETVKMLDRYVAFRKRKGHVETRSSFVRALVMEGLDKRRKKKASG